MTETTGSRSPLPGPATRTSPFVSVWLHPGATVARMATSGSAWIFYPLAAAWGASYNLTLGIRRGYEAGPMAEAGIPSPWVIVAVNVVFGAVFGIAVLWALSFLLARLGRAFGGSGGAQAVRTALAWSSVPHVPNLALALVAAGLGGAAVLSGPHSFESSAAAGFVWFAFLVTSGILSTWGFVIAVAGLHAVMGISVARSLGVYLVTGVILIVVILLLAVGVALLFGA